MNDRWDGLFMLVISLGLALLFALLLIIMVREVLR